MAPDPGRGHHPVPPRLHHQGRGLHAGKNLWCAPHEGQEGAHGKPYYPFGFGELWVGVLGRFQPVLPAHLGEVFRVGAVPREGGLDHPKSSHPQHLGQGAQGEEGMGGKAVQEKQVHA